MKFRLRLLLVAFAVCFLLVAALSSVSIIRFSQLNSRVTAVEHSYQVTNLINLLGEQVRELDMYEFRFLVTRDSAFLGMYERAAMRVKRSTDSLKSLTRGHRFHQEQIILFDSDLALYHSAARKSMRHRTSYDSIHFSEPYEHSRTLMSTAIGRLSEMSVHEDTQLKERTAERVSYQQLTSAMIIVLSIVFGVLTLILFFFLLREFRRRVLYQAELQQKMIEIAQSKEELEHIAYATSHYLQEPLRKIRILTDKWKHQQKSGASPADNAETLDRVAAAAARMQDLVSEMMILTSLDEDAGMVPCDLGDYVKSVAESMSARIGETGARLEIEKLPVIQGHPDQIRLLFKNLLDNALKFTRPGIPPVISIAGRKADPDELGQDMPSERLYYCVTIQDNGLGFDNMLADKMFGIFRQLHSEQDGYEGKGTGLAICRRIMSIHKGRIIAHGFSGSGATFKLYFPAEA